MGIYWLVANHDRNEKIDPFSPEMDALRASPKEAGMVAGLLGQATIAMIAWGGWAGCRLEVLPDDGAEHEAAEAYADATPRALALLRERGHLVVPP